MDEQVDGQSQVQDAGGARLGQDEAELADAIAGLLPRTTEEPIAIREREQRLRLRDWYAKSILIGLGAEAFASLVALFLLGLGILHLDRWIADAFFVTVFGEIVGLANIVVKHLFPSG
ncbi:MAG: hypothetical protein M0Z66_07790 [Thermaerobacter sp.]|nr:hypothetical protein [Thermaerobacter sp.]